MKRGLFLVFTLFLSIAGYAYDIAVENTDGVTIYYNYINNGTELEVAPPFDFNYRGVVNIPEEVTYKSHPRKVTGIGERAFYGCQDLTSVNIPNGVTSIGENAFFYCSRLTSVNIPNSVTSIGNYAFASCKSLTSVNIPNGVTSIGEKTFNHCSGLHFITIPNSVKSIGENAFYCCNGLTSITIPNSVTSIGKGAFEGCYSLTSVISKMENPCMIYSNCFSDDVFYNITLYIPKGTMDKYKSTNYWNKFLFMVEGDPESGTQPEVKKCATPSISYSNKRLAFSCETEGVEYVYEIKDTDIKNGNGSTVDLSATYEISVYATKSGYENSNKATATLVWTEAIFTETTVPPASAKAIRESFPALISANSGNITVKSEANGQAVTAYTVDGLFLGNATVSNGQAVVPTSLQKGTVTIVKIGSKSVKIVMQ